jgi:hemerythrin-like domain-containing protein
MDSSITMNQVIHGAVRRDFKRLVSALERVQDGDVPRAKDLERAYAHLHDQLTHHHQSEDRYIFPALGGMGIDPGLVATMEWEHDSMSAALADTRAAMATFARSGSRADASAAHDSVVRTLASVEKHLDHEEGELEPALRPHAESPEWKEIENKLKRQPPTVAGPFFAWLTDGMRDEHRAFLRKSIPPPVTLIMGRVFGRRYNREIAQVWRSA